MTYLLDTNAGSDLMRADRRIETWIAGLPSTDRLVFLDSLRCEPVPQSAAEHYAVIKLARQQSGLTLDENDLWVSATARALGATLVSRDKDFGGIPGLSVPALE